jgi:hypothetical protein
MIPSNQIEILIKALLWKAAQLEEAALDATEADADKMRQDAQSLREKVSQIKGERVPVRDDEPMRMLVMMAIKEHQRFLKNH